MGAVLLLAGLLLGIVIGAAIGYLFARGRLASTAADLSGRARAADERARAPGARAPGLERRAAATARAGGGGAPRRRRASADDRAQRGRTGRAGRGPARGAVPEPVRAGAG